VSEFVEVAFAHIGRGSGIGRPKPMTSRTKELASIDPRYFRPTEADQLLGNPAKAKRKLGWSQPTRRALKKCKLRSWHAIRHVLPCQKAPRSVRQSELWAARKGLLTTCCAR
jgi:GDP-mannose 4,6 dehydratase